MRAHLAILAALVMLVSGTGVVAAAGTGRPDLPVTFDASTARVSWDDGRPLAIGAGSPLATASAFLAAQGRDPRTIASLRIDRTATWRGLSHVTFRQEVDGLPIAGAYAKLAFDASGALVHAIDSLVAVPGVVVPGATTAEVALAAAIAGTIPMVADRPAVASRAGDIVTFARTAAFFQAPTARAVLLARESGRLERAWQVTTWTGDDNLLDVTVVDASGVLAATERRTANDTYKVFVEDPGKDSQTVEPGANWLSGSQTTIQITGPNAKAYLDRDGNNAADAGGTAVTDGNFLATANLGIQPDTTANQGVAVQNLFYLNNVMHDVLKAHGFVVAQGNFEGADPVLAEAQDGSGMDNANMSTPADGSSPRMQMYLWSSLDPSHEVVLPGGGSTVSAYGAAFGPALTTSGVSATLAYVNDGSGTTGDACQSMPRGSLKSRIAIIDRGFCTFVTKVTNAASAGAVGAIIVNNIGDPAFLMGGSGSVKIPSVMVALADRQRILDATTSSSTTKIRLRDPAPTRIDGDLDSDIVFHEYGHGLTWRMIGSMSGPMAGAIGEGASDVLAMIMNGDDRIGEYAASDPDGIRTSPYASMKKDYSSMTGAEVHDDGEVYGRIGWLLRKWYLANSLTTGDLLDTWIAGFDLTPAGPSMTSMRDGMLAAATGSATETCIIWHAFAAAGVGEGASATVRRGSITATSRFGVPGSTNATCDRPAP